MATWQNTSLIMIRAMLNDAGCGTSTYTTDRLNELLITAAYMLPIDINFATAYVVDVEQSTITPDPITKTDGPEFINFMVLRAACMADEGNFRNSALLQGVKARCGPAILETSAYGQYLRDLLTKGPCKTYIDMKDAYNISYEGGRILRAVMSPFTSNDWSPPIGGGSNSLQDTNNALRNRGRY